MKVSYNWLQTYFDKPLPKPDRLAEVITFGIFEVESIDKIGNDYVLDVKVLPDRAHDCLSHWGIAKEISALLDYKIKIKDYKGSKGKPTNLKIEIQSDKYRRYIGRIIRNVKVGQSPKWLKELLEAVGQKSINNLVDAANFVMLDLGQPIHVFDLDKLSSEKIIIRDAKDKEQIITLDDKKYELIKDDLVIADEANTLAIAGVKGGKKAVVDEDTKNIVIEVANFDPISVRKTSRHLNLLTDAAKRFENELTPELCSMAMERIFGLILDVAGGEAEESVDIYPKKQESKKITFSAEEINKILGTNISADEIEKILKRLNINSPLRLDINGIHDVAEEVGRIYGYNNIKSKKPKLDFKPKTNETFYKILWARKKLVEDGYREVMNYTFQDKGKVEVLGSAIGKNFLRENLSDGLKESYELNKLNAPLIGLQEVKIFEIGIVFPEEVHIAYADKNGITEKSLDEFCKNIEIKNSYDDLLTTSYLSITKFKPWSLYPFIPRDIAVWLPEKETPEKLEKLLKENSSQLLTKGPNLIDTFKKEERISYAYRLVFQAMDRTLTDAEVNQIMEEIYSKIKKEYPNWEIR